MSSFGEKLYLSLPEFLQEAAIVWQGGRVRDRRYGGDFQKIFRLAQKRLAFTPGQLDDYRAWRLSEHLKYARHSPFWAERFIRHGVLVNASNPFDELAKMPVLTKEEVRVNASAIQNPLFDGHHLMRGCTSGTTGAGLVFYEPLSSEWQRWAVWWRYRNQIGISFDTLCGQFSGRSVVPIGQRRPPFWRTSNHTNQLIFSPYHLNAANIRAYIDEIRDRRITWIHGYPSTMQLLASLMQDVGISPPDCLKVITTGAENLSDQQRLVVSRAFGVPVFEHYGLAESTANFSQQPDGKIFVDEDFAGVEFLPAAESGQYSIVGTNWHNHAFPLFRYDCGDLCRRREGTEASPRGMRSREILAIDGRQEDVLLLSNGIRIGRLDHIFKEMVNIREAQIIQHAPGEAIFRVVRGADYDESDEKQLRREIVQRLGAFCQFHIVYVPSIARTKSGKLRLVVSTLSAASPD